MSVSDCIAALVAEGKINKKQAERARAIYRAIHDDPALDGLDETTRIAHAAVETGKIMTAAAEAKKLELARRVQVYNANLDRIRAHQDGPLAGFMALYDRDLRNRAPGDGFDRINVTAMAEDYGSRLASKMHEVDAYKPTLGGLKQDTFGVRNMVHEVFGVDTGDHVAAAAARAWRSATDWGVQQARDLGRAFETDKDWRLPQAWTSDRVRKFGDAAFRADIEAETRAGGLVVIDPETGAKVASAERRAAVVADASRHIREDLGRVDKHGMSSVFSQEARTFRFTDGETGATSYLRLMDKYGQGQGRTFAMLQDHAQSMARELALLHVMGPKPAAMGDQLLNDSLAGAAKIEAARIEFEQHGTPLPEGATPRTRGSKLADLAYASLGENKAAASKLNDYMLGRLSGGGSRAVAGFFSGIRSWLTSANLGSALISAVPGDTANFVMAARFRGFEGGRIAADVAQEFAKHDPGREAFAARLGIVSSAASRVAIGTKQFGDEMFGRGVMARAADFVMRAQRLHHWDETLRTAWTMESLAAIGDRAGKGWGELDEPFRGLLTDYGFTPDEWGTLASMEHLEFRGARFAMPDSLQGDLRAKLMSAINDEKQFAYLAGGSNRVRAATAATSAGTVAGELQRSFFMYKTFSMSMLMTHGLRAAQQVGREGSMAYAAQLGLFMTMAGAVAYQAKQVIQGKDPIAMTTPSFWAEAALQGGALGIYGDFLRDAFSRTGGDLKDAVFGPLSMPFQAAGELTSAMRRSAEDDKPLSIGGALARDVQRFTPGSSLWYGRLIFNRAIVDTLQKMIDPDHAKSFHRAQQRAAKLYGQGFWWAPGDAMPSRGPDLSAATGGAR